MILQRSSKLSSPLTTAILMHLCLYLAVSQLDSSCEFEGESASEFQSISLCNYTKADVKFCELFSEDMEVIVDHVVSYVGGTSLIKIVVSPNVTHAPSLYYKLCYSLNSSSSGLIGCVYNESTTVTTRYNWTQNGEAVILAGVYNNASFLKFRACASANVTVAGNGGLSLTVVVMRAQEAGSPVPGVRVQSDPILPTGNISFIMSAMPTSGTAKHSYYSVNFGDGSSVANVPSSLVYHHYTSAGEYAYTVEAIAVVNSTEAYRAVHSGNFTLMDAIHSIDVEVNGNGSVKAGSWVDMELSADGSTPIKVCWSIEPAHNMSNCSDSNSIMDTINCTREHTGNITDTPTATTALPLQSCGTIVNTNFTINTSVVFDTAGEFIIYAMFSNTVSSKQGTFKITVKKDSPSPVVVVSSFTAVAVVVAVLAAVVIAAIVVVVGGYIPYRRYRKRMTETANFTFVDLTDHSSTLAGKGRAVVTWVRKVITGQKKPERIGLVNLGSTSSEGQLLYQSTSDSMAAFDAGRDTQET